MIRKASAWVLYRPTDPPEIFLVQRSKSVSFFPHYWAFPGGTILPSDRSSLEGAFRELFEETGILPGGGGISNVESAREELLAGRKDFPSLLRELRIDLPSPTLLTRILTPSFHPTRFDTTFYLLKVEGVEPRIVEGELVRSDWKTPREWIGLFERGEILIAPPVLAILRTLDLHGIDEGAEILLRESHLPHDQRFKIEFHPGIETLPLETQTLPPATTTNAYILGRSRVVLIDPGPPQPELSPLLSRVESLLRKGGRVEAILLTHGHRDHLEGAQLLRERTQAPLLAGKEARSEIPLKVDGYVEEGETFELGIDDRTGRPWRLSVVELPGHTRGSVGILDSRFQALVVGDLVSTVSTVVLDVERGGDMDDYLNSLQKAISLSPPIVHPGHGPPSPGVGVLEKTLEHRLWRERRILEELRTPGLSEEELLRRVYNDVDPSLLEVARLNLKAHLRRIERKGVF